MYSLSHHLYSQQNFDIKWIKCLEKILNETGFSNIWQTQTFKSTEWLKQSIKQTLLDQFLQDWNSSVHNSQGFQSGPVPGTFTRLRSCIVPAEITEPPKISGGQNHKYDGR